MGYAHLKVLTCNSWSKIILADEESVYVNSIRRMLFFEKRPDGANPSHSIKLN